MGGFGIAAPERRLCWRLEADGALAAVDPRDGDRYIIEMDGDDTRLAVHSRYRPTRRYAFIGKGANAVLEAAQQAEALAWPIR